MKVTNYEIEIETLLNRIFKDELNLQPSFQRGEIWPLNKKQKLIDTIFRGWRMPPIHLLENPELFEEVLDGQQRLAAIRDFFNNEYSFNGQIEPKDEEFNHIDKLYYEELPNDYKRKFLRYTVTINKLSNYKNEEPAELFFRLNQPTSLSPSELRNAFIGTPRNQIKELVIFFTENGANASSIGFSNTRLSYDDILSRVCTTIENNSLRTKITSKDISQQYRENRPYKDSTIKKVKETIKYFFIINPPHNSNNPRLTKSTLYTWLIFLYRHLSLENDKIDRICRLFQDFESKRIKANSPSSHVLSEFDKFSLVTENEKILHDLFNRYNNRASINTNEVKAVLERDFIIEYYYYLYYAYNNIDSVYMSNLSHIFERATSYKDLNLYLDTVFINEGWGELGHEL